MTEDDVVAACDAFARATGWRVESYSDKRRVRTHPGLPDRRYVQRGRGYALWAEHKAPGGKVTREQFEWLSDEIRANGLACVIDHPAQFEALCRILARGGSIARAEAYRWCCESVALAGKRGFRGEKVARAPKKKTGGRVAA